jgi:hypothetical protein
MPAFYKIDKERKLVMSSGSGVLTIEDILMHQERLLEDPDFDSSFSQLTDFTQFAKIDITADQVRIAAKKNIFSPRSRRALVVKNDLQYGLARMFEIHRDSAGEVGIRVFRNMDEALDWVLSKDTASEDAPGTSG